MAEVSAVDNRKLRALCQPGHAKNWFVSLELASDGNILGERQNFPLTFTTTFAWRETDDVRAGLSFSCIAGALDECSASITGKTHDEVEMNVETKSVAKTARTTTSGGTVNAKVESLGGSLGSGKSVGQAREEERTETHRVSSATFTEFSRGQTTEWCFYAAPGKDFLDEQRSFTLAVVPEPTCSKACGYFHVVDAAEHICVLPREGGSLSGIRKWIILARLRKTLRAHPIHVDFRLVSRQSD